jgi:hypothetical protein
MAGMGHVLEGRERRIVVADHSVIHLRLIQSTSLNAVCAGRHSLMMIFTKIMRNVFMRILIKAPFGYFCFGTIEWSLWFLYYNNISSL